MTSSGQNQNLDNLNSGDKKANKEVEQLVEPAGHFRIYLGSAPGVGKTYNMLCEARRRYERGADIVVGIVESHGRPNTEALLQGLPIIPRKLVQYKGKQFEEMDLVAILKRKPKVALVDELAHTNIIGSGPNEKRWQDVLQLLEAGIDVITTVNIQHLESLADTVQMFTGVTIQERVPDWLIRKANQVELVDSSPEQLRRRMLHGNIYSKERIEPALTNFFKLENLIALRELALRFVADETDEDLLRYISHHKVRTGNWETTERIMAGVTTKGKSEAVIRRAARMASRSKGDLHVVHVTAGDIVSESDHKIISNLKTLVEDVDGQWHELTGSDIAKTLVTFANENEITQIIIGSAGRNKVTGLITSKSIIAKILKYASKTNIDVHIISRLSMPADPETADNP